MGCGVAPVLVDVIAKFSESGVASLELVDWVRDVIVAHFT